MIMWVWSRYFMGYGDGCSIITKCILKKYNCDTVYDLDEIVPVKYECTAISLDTKGNTFAAFIFTGTYLFTKTSKYLHIMPFGFYTE